MRRSPLWAFVLCAWVALSSPAGAQEEAASILQKAIQAHGGADKLAKQNAARARSRGTVEVEGMYVPFTAESAVQLPDQHKTRLQLNLQGLSLDLLQVLNGNQAWAGTPGQVKEIRGPLLEEMRESLYATRVQTLVPLLQDKAFTLAPVKPVTLAGRPAVGVKVVSPGHKDVTLYFDKENGLLLKSERRAFDGHGVEVFKETLYGDYKDVDGVKAATKVTTLHDGRKFMEGEVLELKFLDKIAPSEFSRP